MTYEEITIGNTVRLASDDIAMTVIDKRIINSKEQVRCQWRDKNDQIREDVFNPVALVSADPINPSSIYLG